MVVDLLPILPMRTRTTTTIPIRPTMILVVVVVVMEIRIVVVLLLVLDTPPPSILVGRVSVSTVDCDSKAKHGIIKDVVRWLNFRQS